MSTEKDFTWIEYEDSTPERPSGLLLYVGDVDIEDRILDLINDTPTI
jgi:hypothetical protein